jgi:Sec-independent protein translocase protein TatA
MSPMLQMLAIGFPSPAELFIVAILAAVVFRNQLPRVARYLGGCVTDFKRGLAAVEDEAKIK